MTKSSSRIAVVTGGGRGLGRSAVLEMAARGIDAVVTYRENEEAARAVVAELEARGRRGVALPLDVARVASFPSFVEALRGHLARRWERDTFDVLVHNGASGGHAPMAEIPETQLDELLAMHLKGPLMLTQQLLPLVADGGAIVQISTGLTRYTYPGQGVYAAAKAGFETIARYLARELGPRGITVNSIAPGGVATDFGGGVMRDAGVQAHVIAQTPLGRIAGPDDIGRVVASIAAGDLAWVTGQRIEATGGYGL